MLFPVSAFPYWRVLLFCLLGPFVWILTSSIRSPWNKLNSTRYSWRGTVQFYIKVEQCIILCSKPFWSKKAYPDNFFRNFPLSFLSFQTYMYTYSLALRSIICVSHILLTSTCLLFTSFFFCPVTDLYPDLMCAEHLLSAKPHQTQWLRKVNQLALITEYMRLGSECILGW